MSIFKRMKIFHNHNSDILISDFSHRLTNCVINPSITHFTVMTDVAITRFVILDDKIIDFFLIVILTF